MRQKNLVKTWLNEKNNIYSFRSFLTEFFLLSLFLPHISIFHSFLVAIYHSIFFFLWKKKKKIFFTLITWKPFRSCETGEEDMGQSFSKSKQGGFFSSLQKTRNHLSVFTGSHLVWIRHYRSATLGGKFWKRIPTRSSFTL